MKRLSEIRTGTGIPFLTPEVSPGTHCPMRMASVISEDISGLSSLVVGMPECTTYSRLFSPYPEGENGELHWLYVLDSREVIFGCRDGVMEAVRKMDKEGAKAIIIIATCIPELIGEDLESIVYEIQPEINARITAIMLGQFKSVSYPAGAWKTMEAMAGLMDEGSINKNMINILGRSPKEEHVPMPAFIPALERKGIRLRYLAPGSSVTDFSSSSDAVLNIVVSPYAYPLALKMKKKFNIPFISLHDLYSPKMIGEAYGEVSKVLRIDITKEFEEQKQEAGQLEKKAVEIFQNKKYVMALRVDLPLPLTLYFTEYLKMEPLLLHLEEFYPGDQDYVKAVTEKGFNPFVCRIVNEYTALPYVDKFNPDLCFGYLPETHSLTGWVENMFDLYGWVGYERTIELLNRMIQSAEDII